MRGKCQKVLSLSIWWHLKPSGFHSLTDALASMTNPLYMLCKRSLPVITCNSYVSCMCVWKVDWLPFINHILNLLSFFFQTLYNTFWCIAVCMDGARIWWGFRCVWMYKCTWSCNGRGMQHVVATLLYI